MEPLLQDSDETASLLDRAASGDREAIEPLFRRHLAEIKRSVQRRLRPETGSRFDASDVVQETYHTALRALDDYLTRRPLPFRLWLLRSAQNRVVDLERTHLKRAKRSVDRELPLPDDTSMQLARRFVAAEPSPSTAAWVQERSRIVRRCLARLSETHRQVLMLRTFDGLTNIEVATLMEIHPDAAKRKFSQALVQLRSLLIQAGVKEDCP
ncbi:MAG: sigma-70 family RNA polymerase sigma factor [Pirellulales bacterium]